MAKTHRELYPEQYNHPVVGKRVRVKSGPTKGLEYVVERVCGSRFGQMFVMPNGGGELKAYASYQVEVIS